MVVFHVFVGLLSLLAGAVALVVAKGGHWHRRSGTAFVFAMLAMSASGALIAAWIKPNIGSMAMGMLTFYLVATGWLAVRAPLPDVRAWLVGAMLAAFGLGLFLLRLGVEAGQHADGRVDLLPPQPMFLFGAIGLLAAVLDARLLWSGGIAGKHRLARHLWRMGMAMFIATSSFFLGQARQFPVEVRKSGLLVVPVLLVVAVILYWLVRVLWQRRSPGRARTAAPMQRAAT